MSVNKVWLQQRVKEICCKSQRYVFFLFVVRRAELVQPATECQGWNEQFLGPGSHGSEGLLRPSSTRFLDLNAFSCFSHPKVAQLMVVEPNKKTSQGSFRKEFSATPTR